MEICRILYTTEPTQKSKKECKKIAEIAKATIKEFGKIEVRSAKTNEAIGYIKNKETILPFWSSVDFEVDDYLEPSKLTKNGMVQEIKYGYTIDKKGVEVPIIYYILV